MLTNDDLKKIREVMREEIDGLEMKMEHRFNAVDKRLNNIEKHMEQDRKDWSGFFNDAGIFFDEMRNELVKRVKKLEDNQQVSKN